MLKHGFRCKVCNTELPACTIECPVCKVCQEPPAKFAPGDIVKIERESKGERYVYYNTVVDSYYNHDIGMRMYRLNEQMAMPVYREDWLEAVSVAEIARVNKSGLLRPGRMGGFEHPLDSQEVNK